MKTTTIKSILIKLALILMVTHASAQDLVGTRIDVQGSHLTDQMWIFSVATCTRNYDNGWDGYKMFGTPLAPQIFAMEAAGDFQIDAIPDVNNTYIGFRTGIDTIYTMTFTHQNLSQRYQQLFLVDSVAKKTIDIYADGTTYTFTAKLSSQSVRRFKIVTSNPQTVAIPSTPTVSKDTIATPSIPATPVVSNGNSTDPSSTTLAIGSIEPKNSKSLSNNSNSNSNNSNKKLKIYTSQNNIVVENPNNQRGNLKLYNAMSGRLVKTVDFNASGTTTIQTSVPVGSYVANGQTANEAISVRVLIL
ncbi:MAG: hypothetical protein P4L34_08410 [Paludibacter sp.]|nr:hypothetical protein [Paludibacter sp.]